MGVISIAYSVPPKLLVELRADNQRFAALFGEDEAAGPEWKVDKLEFFDFEDTHRLLRNAGYPTLQEVLDFGGGNPDGIDHEGYDIQIATPAQVEQIAAELGKVTLAEVRTQGLEDGFRTDRRSVLLKPEDYDFQFKEIEATRTFFAAAAKAGHAVVAAAI